jgi:hypothetical protein
VRLGARRRCAQLGRWGAPTPTTTAPQKSRLSQAGGLTAASQSGRPVCFLGYAPGLGRVCYDPSHPCLPLGSSGAGLPGRRAPSSSPPERYVMTVAMRWFLCWNTCGGSGAGPSAWATCNWQRREKGAPRMPALCTVPAHPIAQRAGHIGVRPVNGRTANFCAPRLGQMRPCGPQRPGPCHSAAC